ncbi:MAG: hypothetical protein KDC34_08220 [Saprospiraceae bacterium]|nr:hypothetical protein [Saprospiraceae bacterium]
MQRFFGLFLALGLTFSLYSQGSGPMYTVQIGTFLESKSSDFEGIRPYGFLYASSLGGNMSRIFMGGYNSFESAEAIAQQTRQKGYIDASVVQLDPSKGQIVTVIQLGVEDGTKAIDWPKFQKAGKLFVLLNNQQVKVVAGIYPDIDAAKASLRDIRQKGFDDAFIKNVNSVLLHEVDAFITGKTASKTVPQEYSFDAPQATMPQSALEPMPQEYDVVAPIPKGMTSSPAPPQAMVVNEPSIRSNIKRTSALDLQRLLKKEGSYKSSLDGYYGKGTKSAYDQVYNNLSSIQKYRKFAESRSFDEGSDQVGIQYYINNIPYDQRTSESGLQKINAPIAMAYRAYILFVNGQSGTPVNNLMNQAIQGAFSSSKPNPVPGFDYTAAYAYTSLDQLILHLRYIHAATDDADVPCWLFQLHPAEAMRAFEPGQSMSSNNYRIQNCGGFSDWEEVRLLTTIAEDMNAGSSVNPAELSDGRSRQTRYLLAPKALSEQEDSAVASWHKSLQTNLAQWALKDAMLEDTYTAFGIAFYQTQVLLEDYYMDKGLNSGEAEGLALATLKAMIGPYVKRFI